MLTSFNEPQIKAVTETILLARTDMPAIRWSVDPRFSFTRLDVTVANLSKFPASLKFQDSNDSPALDAKCTIGISPNGASDVIQFIETYGEFNATFTDISGAAIVSLPPGAEKIITFVTKKAFIQVIATTANNAKVQIVGKTSNTISQIESIGPRVNTAPTADEQEAEIADAGVVSSSAYESHHILDAVPGTLISVTGYNSGASQFIQLFDSKTVPANGTAPLLVFTIPATSNFSLDIPITGLPYSNGMVVCNSSTAPTKTEGSANCYFTAVVK